MLIRQQWSSRYTYFLCWSWSPGVTCLTVVLNKVSPSWMLTIDVLLSIPFQFVWVSIDSDRIVLIIELVYSPSASTHVLKKVVNGLCHLSSKELYVRQISFVLFSVKHLIVCWDFCWSADGEHVLEDNHLRDAFSPYFCPFHHLLMFLIDFFMRANKIA